MTASFPGILPRYALDETLIIVARGKTHKVDRSRIDNEPVLLACLRHYLPA